MKIRNISNHTNIYTSNVYLITGDWNTLNDINTLIDVGRDPAIFKELENASTGVGKRRVEQVILTHSHYDHVSLLPIIKEKYNPKVYAVSNNLQHVDYFLKGGEYLKIGDKYFEVIYCPGHSNDSVLIYCEEEGVLFAGDSPLIILNNDNTYSDSFIDCLKYISSKRVHSIYFGHGLPMFDNCQKALKLSLENIKK